MKNVSKIKPTSGAFYKKACPRFIAGVRCA